ncbi:hypothetical protein LEP1GSC058_2328 [Leptospira fainei serovar Hurstbridge str. BUT 6]|uniref:Uncharacterized protein n=1 Tax=Leptospira fainei serovar Hurstbridge str. BUT 6 TaxID=1193011 RepID=S3V4A6_9LEPT|nr:hypothetical protein LEP1GSC058_2328 [Leptospira fainei serovar Hurstbridge str. BUT 6]
MLSVYLVFRSYFILFITDFVSFFPAASGPFTSIFFAIYILIIK